MRCLTARAYDVQWTRNLLDPSNPELDEALGSRPCLVVTEPVVDRLYGRSLRAYFELRNVPATIHVVELSERTKTIEAVLDVCAAAQRYELARRDPLVAFGGGICSDVVSVAATLIRRGIPYWCIPTTLVGQVDAALGLKGGVNFGGTKNYLGCFSPPAGVLIDRNFLATVPREELSAGFAEIVKVALVLDAELFELVRDAGPTLITSSFTDRAATGERILVRAGERMLAELSTNPYEDRTLERVVDFGHTFSARLEEVSEHRLRHGEAVAFDVALSSALAVELGLFPERDLEIVLETLTRLGLAVDCTWASLPVLRQAIDGSVRHRDGALNLVVPAGIGVATLLRDPSDLPATALAKALARLRAAPQWPAIGVAAHQVAEPV